MTDPMISVVIPNYNRETLIGDTLDSVINQGYQYWEAIVVDDGSTDNSNEVVRRYSMKDNRIKLIQRNREPKGANTCRNIGIEQANGKYIIFLDSDDLLAKNCFENRIKKMAEYPKCQFLVFPMIIFNKEPDDCRTLGNIDTKEDDLSRFLRGDVVWGISNLFWRNKSIKLLGVFDEQLSCWQEYDLHIRALIKGFEYEKFLDHEVDCFVRHHQGVSIGKSSMKSLAHTKSQHYLCWKIFNLLKGCKNSNVKKNFKMIPLKVIIGYCHGQHISQAWIVFNEAVKNKVFTRFYELYAVRLLIVCYKIKLHQVKGFYRLRKVLLKRFNFSSDHLRHKYKGEISYK